MLEIAQAVCNEAQRVQRNVCVRLKHVLHGHGGPCHCRGRFHSLGADRVVGIPECSYTAKSVARTDETEYDLMSRGCHLRQLYAAAREDEELRGGVAFVEEEPTASSVRQAREGNDSSQWLRLHSLEQGNVRQLMREICVIRQTRQ